MADAVPREERHARPAERAGDVRPRRRPERRVDGQFVPVGEFGHVVQAAAADDADLDGHRRLERVASGNGNREPADRESGPGIGPGAGVRALTERAPAQTRHDAWPRAACPAGRGQPSDARRARPPTAGCRGISRVRAPGQPGWRRRVRIGLAACDAIEQRLELARRQERLLDVGQQPPRQQILHARAGPEPTSRADLRGAASDRNRSIASTRSPRCRYRPSPRVRRIGGRHRSPVGGLQREQRLDRRRRPIGALAVGLVDHVDVGDLHDPRLQRLHIVSRAWHHDDDRDVGGADDLDLVLPDADGLDQHDVEAGRIEHERHVAGRARQAAEMPARGHAADEDALVAGVLLHAHAIAEQRAAGEGTGRIDGDDADAAATRRAIPRQGDRRGCSCRRRVARSGRRWCCGRCADGGRR